MPFTARAARSERHYASRRYRHFCHARFHDIYILRTRGHMAMAFRADEIAQYQQVEIIDWQRVSFNIGAYAP